MRAPNLIHGCTFDVASEGNAHSSEALGAWLRDALLPVVDEVLARHDRPNKVCRIDRLVIDLGEVLQEHAEGALARALDEQLAAVLRWPSELPVWVTGGSVATVASASAMNMPAPETTGSATGTPGSADAGRASGLAVAARAARTAWAPGSAGGAAGAEAAVVAAVEAEASVASVASEAAEAAEVAAADRRADGVGRQLLAFLRSGSLPWSVAADQQAAHEQLLRRVLASSGANAVLSNAVRDRQMLTRLVRQFAPSALAQVCFVLHGTQPAAIEEMSEADWLSLLPAGPARALRSEPDEIPAESRSLPETAAVLPNGLMSSRADHNESIEEMLKHDDVVSSTSALPLMSDTLRAPDTAEQIGEFEATIGAASASGLAKAIVQADQSVSSVANGSEYVDAGASQLSQIPLDDMTAQGADALRDADSPLPSPVTSTAEATSAGTEAATARPAAALVAGHEKKRQRPLRQADVDQLVQKWPTMTASERDEVRRQLANVPAAQQKILIEYLGVHPDAMRASVVLELLGPTFISGAAVQETPAGHSALPVSGASERSGALTVPSPSPPVADIAAQGQASQIKDVTVAPATEGALTIQRLVQQGDVEQLAQIWPAMSASQNDELRQQLEQLPGAQKKRFIDSLSIRLGAEQASTLLAVLRPASASRVASPGMPAGESALSVLGKSGLSDASGARLSKTLTGDSVAPGSMAHVETSEEADSHLASSAEPVAERTAAREEALANASTVSSPAAGVTMIRNLVQRADALQLARLWPTMTASQRDTLRRQLARVDVAAQQRLIASLGAHLGAEQASAVLTLTRPSPARAAAMSERHAGPPALAGSDKFGQPDEPAALLSATPNMTPTPIPAGAMAVSEQDQPVRADSDSVSPVISHPEQAATGAKASSRRPLATSAENTATTIARLVTQADVAQLARMWPTMPALQRDELCWHLLRLPTDQRQRLVELFCARLTREQAGEVVAMIQSTWTSGLAKRQAGHSALPVAAVAEDAGAAAGQFARISSGDVASRAKALPVETPGESRSTAASPDASPNVSRAESPAAPPPISSSLSAAEFPELSGAATGAARLTTIELVMRQVESGELARVWARMTTSQRERFGLTLAELLPADQQRFVGAIHAHLMPEQVAKILALMPPEAVSDSRVAPTADGQPAFAVRRNHEVAQVPQISPAERTLPDLPAVEEYEAAQMSPAQPIDLIPRPFAGRAVESAGGLAQAPDGESTAGVAMTGAGLEQPDGAASPTAENPTAEETATLPPQEIDTMEQVLRQGDMALLATIWPHLVAASRQEVRNQWLRLAPAEQQRHLEAIAKYLHPAQLGEFIALVQPTPAAPRQNAASRRLDAEAALTPTMPRDVIGATGAPSELEKILHQGDFGSQEQLSEFATPVKGRSASQLSRGDGQGASLRQREDASTSAKTTTPMPAPESATKAAPESATKAAPEAAPKPAPKAALTHTAPPRPQSNLEASPAPHEKDELMQSDQSTSQPQIDPALAMFRDWQRHKLELSTLALTLAELKQWLNWWLMHDPRLVNQDCSLMLEAIDTQCAQMRDPVAFMKLVLTTLRKGEPLDLESLALATEKSTASDDKPGAVDVIASLQSHQAIRNFVGQQASDDAHLGSLNSAQLHQLVRAWIGDASSLFLHSVEEQALQASDLHQYFRSILQSLLQGQTVDLDSLATPPQALSLAPVTATGAQPALAAGPSPLPPQLQQSLPQRLADALLRADLAPLQVIWPEIMRFHADMVIAAAKRYLRRPQERANLAAHADPGMLMAMLKVISPPVARQIEPLVSHAARCNLVLPEPLTADTFRQRILNFAFVQAMEGVEGGWLHGVLQALGVDRAWAADVAHAWRAILPASAELDCALYGEHYLAAALEEDDEQADHASMLGAMLKTELCRNYPQLVDEQLREQIEVQLSFGAVPAASSETMLAMLLMRSSPLGRQEQLAVGLLLKRLLEKELPALSGALESALSQPMAITRLTSIAPGPVLAQVLVLLQPALAAQLPAALNAMAGVVAVVNVPAMQPGGLWSAIYQSAFVAADPVAPSEFVRALIQRASGRTDLPLPPEAPSANPTATLDVLLRPMVTPETPAEVQPAEEEPAWAGESNIRNAGMVIFATYMQRLFGILELTKDGQFVSDEASQRAVHLLQYAVNGESSTPEYQLVLNKLFCGIHGGLPIVRGIDMTQKEKDIIEQMLNGVIAHWSALGKTSVSGLRQTFLQREGHLHFEDDGWHLKIPQATFDMLLDRLPWSFAMIKFPWMPHPLHVTWR